MVTIQRRSRDLKRDLKGNTLMIFAFALFPMLGMIGGALDISRAYLVKSRLQQACDAGALAGRRSMTTADFATDPVAKPTANKFFNLNFTPGRYGSYATSGTDTITYSAGSDMIVHGKATMSVPTVIMKLFGKDSVDLVVNCEAQLQLPNSDIMFVLDTTGSMTEVLPGDTQTKIAALRSAVSDFYDTLTEATPPGSRIRYGFVPYSSTVNVGMLLKRDWIQDNPYYQTREPDGPPEEVESAPAADRYWEAQPWAYVSGSNNISSTIISSEDCNAPPNDLSYKNEYSPTVSETQPNGDLWRRRTLTQTIDGHKYWTVQDATTQKCTLYDQDFDKYKQKREEIEKPNPNAGKKTTTKKYKWHYGFMQYSTAQLKGNRTDGLMQGGAFDAFVANDHTKDSIKWPGFNGACIEERQANKPYHFDTPWDLDVDTAPDKDHPETQWKPALPQVVFARGVTDYSRNTDENGWGWKSDDDRTYTNYYRLSTTTTKTLRAACPSPSRRLAVIAKQDKGTKLTPYLNALKTEGQTYQDIGFLWGLRLLSPDGLFKDDNKGNISRNIIFMTDGQTDTDAADYDAYGLAALDSRRTNAAPRNNDQNDMVDKRLTYLCKYAREQKGITVWVIAFGTDLTPVLEGCASADRAYKADNKDELNATFADIASRIAKLRVTQ